MARYEVKQITNKSEWEDFLSTRDEANFLQSWYWGEFQENIGHEIHRSGFYIDDRLAGVMLGIVEPAKRGRYLTVPGGPIIDFKDNELFGLAVDEMKSIGKKLNCVFVRVRPQLTNEDWLKNLFKGHKFRPAQMHLHAELTSQLDITRELDEIKNNLRKNTRYELKQAKKRGVIISSTQEPEAIDKFYEIQLETASRHGFVPYSKKFLKEQFMVFASNDLAKLYSAHTADQKLIAQAFIIFYNKESAYHYGASTSLGRTEPGAVAIQWEAIKEAKLRGMSRHNFWGVVKPEETDHRFYGVSVFKRGFKGEDVEYLHAQDLVLNKAKYLPNLVVETIRKRKRKV